MSKFVVIGLLRRDADVIFSTDDEDEATTAAERAVREARVEEAFVLPVIAHFRASEINWANPDVGQLRTLDINSSTLPPLNPGSGEQEADPSNIAEPQPEVSISSERRGSMEAVGGESTPLGGKAGNQDSEKAGTKPADPNSTVSDLAEAQGTTDAKSDGKPAAEAPAKAK